MSRNMADLFNRFNMVIEIQEREAKNNGQCITSDCRDTYSQLIDLLTIARKLKMQEAINWLQPQIVKMTN